MSANSGITNTTSGVLRSNTPGMPTEIKYDKTVMKNGDVIFNFEDGTSVSYNEKKNPNRNMQMTAGATGAEISHANGLEIKLDNKKTEKWQRADASNPTSITLIDCDNCNVDAKNDKFNSIFFENCDNLKISKDEFDKTRDLNDFR